MCPPRFRNSAYKQGRSKMLGARGLLKIIRPLHKKIDGMASWSATKEHQLSNYRPQKRSYYAPVVHLTQK